MHIPKSEVWFVLAAYNEEKRISKTINDLKKKGYSKIVVVDDGSTDNTYNLAKSQGVHVIRHIINRGQGAALQTGMNYALKKGARFIVHFDADGQHRVEDVHRLLKPLLNKEADIVLGSRFLNKQFKSNIPLNRLVYLKFGILFTRLMTGLKLTDTHNGFRAMTRNAAEKLVITLDKMAHASEILELIAKNNLRFVEVPVIIEYDQERMQNSMNGFISGVKIILNTIFHKIKK